MSRRRMLATGLATGVAAVAAGCAPAGFVRRVEARWPPEGAFVEVDGLNVHYVESGPADGAAEAPPVILLHGATGNLRDMTFELALRLAARRRVIAFDRPGLGYTDRPAERGWDPAVQAEILRAAARKLGAESYIVAGHSWGAAVAMAWAVAHSAEMAGAVSISGATMPWGGGGGLLFDLAASPVLGPPVGAALRGWLGDGLGQDTIARIFRPQTPPEGYAEHVGGPLILRPASFRANGEDLSNLNDVLAAQARRYGEIAAPVEILHGRADQTAAHEIHAGPMAELIPDARVELLDGVGHMAHHAAPETVEAAVERLAARPAARRDSA